MENKFLILNFTVHALGFLAATSCVCWCFYEYFLDLDLSLVEHKTFGGDENSIMPSFSLCLSDPFLEDKLKINSNNLNTTEYKKFLAGKYWEFEISQIDFENVTKKLEDYLQGYVVFYENLTQNYYDNITSLPGHIKKPYISYTGFLWGIMLKCYSVNMPLNSVGVGLRIKNTVFPNSIRPSTAGFTVSLHYPGQFLTSLASIRNNWPNQKEKSMSYYTMLLTINIFEITIRRNTRRNPCNEQWKMDDFEVFQKLVDKTRCKAPHQIWNTSYPVCDTKEKMAAVDLNFFVRRNYSPPCQSVEKVVYEYSEFEPEITTSMDPDIMSSNLWVNDNNSFLLMANLQGDKFKAIVHKKAYDVQALIGNCGGYIGLILGKLLAIPNK